MSSIGNTQKLEESIGGFTTVAGLDDSFLLDNMDEYPGILPYDTSENNIIEDILESNLTPDDLSESQVINSEINNFDFNNSIDFNNSEIESEPIPEKSVWDVFDTAPEEFNNTENNQTESIDSSDSDSIVGLDIPTFSNEFESRIDETLPDKNQMDIGSFFDEFQNETALNESEVKVEQSDSTENLLEQLDNFVPDINSTQDNSFDRESEEFNFEENNNILSDEILSNEILSNEIGNTDDIPIDSLINSDENSEINMDDLGEDLLRLIQSDLDKTKTKKDRHLGLAPIILSDEEIREKLSSFKPVEENNKTLLIELAAIEAEHPSTFQQKKKSKKTDNITWNEPLHATIPPVKTKKIKPEKTHEKKSNKKYLILAAILLLLFSGSFGIWTFLVDNNGWDKLFGSKPDEISVISDSLKSDSNSLINTLKQEEISEVKSEPVQISEQKPVVETTKIEPEKPKVEVKIPEQKPIEISKKSEYKEPIKEKIIKNHKPAKSIAHIEKPKSIIKSNLIKSKSIKIPKLVTEHKEKPVLVKQKSKKQTPVVTPLNEQEKSLYTLEIYSTPSYDDALEFMQHIKKKNLNNIFIKTHKIRDVIWYKVRFGSFTNIEEARTEAIRLGLNSAAVDRVR